MNERKIADNIRKLVGPVGYDSVLCKVVNVTGRTCTVTTLLNDVEIDNVRLCADINKIPGILLTPAKESIVVVTMLDKTNAYISLFSQVDSIVLNGGEQGGLVRVKELTNQLDKLTKRVDGIMDALKNSIPVAQDGGAAYKTGIVTALSSVADKEDFSKIENELVKH